MFPWQARALNGNVEDLDRAKRNMDQALQFMVNNGRWMIKAYLGNRKVPEYGSGIDYRNFTFWASRAMEYADSAERGALKLLVQRVKRFHEALVRLDYGEQTEADLQMLRGLIGVTRPNELRVR